MKEESEKFVLKLNVQKTKIMASGPINSRQIDGETVADVCFFLFGSKITVDGDCSPEIKRRLLLGSKVMTNLDSILEKAMAPHSCTLAWKTPGRRSLEGCSPWGRWGSDTTERLQFHFSLSCIGKGNGNPLQSSCLENSQGRGSLVGFRLWGRRVGHYWSDLAAAAAKQHLALNKQSFHIWIL